ncbi:MAG: lamin tail domain-containing protein, partial [Verrucomicrobia bacterium]|nr:lamin tail domain-containing protein [Verrucomicrobiota bacterium]
MNTDKIYSFFVLASLLVSFCASAGADDEPPGPSSRRTPLAITEIHYHPAERADRRNLEFVEIYNSNPWPEDISGYRLRGETDVNFPQGTVIGAQGFALVAAAPDDLRASYTISDDIPIFGPSMGALSNNGGTMRLEKSNGAVLLDLRYDDRAPWSIAADGTGHSLVLGTPTFGEADPRAWRASTFIDGSPGARDPLPTPAVLALRNVHFDQVTVGFVDLRNSGNEVADLSGCTVAGSALTQPYLFLDGTTIAPGDALRIEFKVSPIEPRLYLWNASADSVIDAFASDGLRHSGAVPAIVINEIMYHPPSGSPDDTYVELHNAGTATVDLSGWRFSDGIDFVIPNGTQLTSGGYLVIASNRDQLLANHPGIDGSLVLGDFTGSLSNGGERIALSQPAIFEQTAYEVVVDEVSYGDGGAWGQWSDGGG